MSYANYLQQDSVNDTAASDYEEYSGTIIWFVINIILITVTVLGNLLTISAILCSRKLYSIVANQFVFSLAVSDLFVGLTIPYHMAFYIAEDFGSGKLNCLLRFVLISFACSSSISNLLVIAADRYVAIVYPLHYNRLITRKSSLILTLFGWSLSFTVAAIPLMWNDWREGISCEMIEVIPNEYMNFVVCPMFVLIWVMMLLLYSRICQEAAGHAKRMRNANSTQSILTLRDSKSFQVMLTILGCFTICWLPYFVITIYSRYNKEAKPGLAPIGRSDHGLVTVMLTILGCFTICWLPYFVITIYSRYNKEAKSAIYYEIAFNLAVANSGMNPIIYAWKNHNFRASFLQLIRCKSPNAHPSAQYVTNHVPSKKSSISNGTCNAVCGEGDGEKCASICDKLELAVSGIERTKGKMNGNVVKLNGESDGSSVETV